MSVTTDVELPIPGTYMFDGQAAMKGYPLNKMCYSFNKAENREEFLKDEDAYCQKYGLTEEQHKAIRERNVLTMIHEGGCIYYLAKFAGIFGLTVQDVGAQQTGHDGRSLQAKDQGSRRVTHGTGHWRTHYITYPCDRKCGSPREGIAG